MVSNGGRWRRRGLNFEPRFHARCDGCSLCQGAGAVLGAGRSDEQENWSSSASTGARSALDDVDSVHLIGCVDVAGP